MSSKQLLRKAYAAYRDGDFAKAEKEAAAVLATDPHSYETNLLLGKCAYKLEDIAKAERYNVAATGLKPLELPGWQGLTELFENCPVHAAKAVAPLKQIIAILESESIGDDRLLQYQLRLADLYRRLKHLSEAEEVLKDALLSLDVTSPHRLKCLCLLADLQLMDYEAAIQQRLAQQFESLSCSIENKEACNYDSLLNRVTGEYAEEALEANHELGGTLTEITSASPPCGPYRKYHDFYLQIFCKAMYTTPASSTDRYNLRLQALERCYKMIHGRSGDAKGLCTTPFPYVTALRLLEINEEIVSGRQRPMKAPLLRHEGTSPKENLIPSMFKKSESSPTLHELTSSPAVGSHGTPRKMSPFSAKSIKIKLTGGLEPFESKAHREPLLTRRHSLERRLSMDGNHTSFRLGHVTPHSSLPSSPRVGHSVGSVPSDMPPVFEASESALPMFMRSNSLSCVRHLHRLDSGFLEKPGQIIGGSSPLVTEVSETIGRKLARVLPWHMEAKIQLVLAVRRREKLPRSQPTDRIDETPVTDFDEVPTVVKCFSDRIKTQIQILDSGIASGTRMAVPRMALVDLLLQEHQYERALNVCNAAIEHIENNAKEGGYPRTQACLTFRLQRAAALLRLNRLMEAQAQYKALAEGVSEGVVSFGDLAGCQHVSVRQAAQKGLINVALAQGDRHTSPFWTPYCYRSGLRCQALRLYEQMMGAGLMGKSPIEHGIAAEYGYMLYEDGDTVRAKQYLEKALEIFSELPLSHQQLTTEADYHFKLAQVYWALGGKWRNEPQFAYDHLTQATSQEGSHQAPAYALLAKWATEVAQDPERAKLYYEKSLELDPNQEAVGSAFRISLALDSLQDQKAQLMKYRSCRAVWVAQGLGEIYLDEGSYQMATQSFQTALKRDPKNPALWERLGAAHTKMQRYTSAQKCFVRALSGDPTRLYALVQSGSCYIQMMELDKGLAVYERAVKHHPESAVAVAGLASSLLESSKAHRQSGFHGLAEDEASRAQAILMSYPKKHLQPQVFYKLLGDVEFQRYSLTRLRCQLEKKRAQSAADFVSVAQKAESERVACLKAAVDWYKKLLKWYPMMGTVWGDYATAQACLDPKTPSEGLIRAGLSLEPNSVELWVLLSRHVEDPVLQEYSLRRALQLKVDCTEAWLHLAHLYHKERHHEKAKQALTQARIHDPASPAVWAGMGEMEGNPVLARAYYVHSMQLGSEVAALTGLVALLNEHGLEFFKGSKGVVKNAVQQSTELSPLDPVFWNAHGLCLEDGQNPVDALFALQIAQTLIEADHRSDTAASNAILINLARVALKAGNVKLSIDSFRRIQHPTAATHLAHAYALHKDGRSGAALLSLEEALKLQKDLETALEVYQLMTEIEIGDKNFAEAFKKLQGLSSLLHEQHLSTHQAHSLLNTWLKLYTHSVMVEAETGEFLAELQEEVEKIAIAVGLCWTAKGAVHYGQHLESCLHGDAKASRQAIKRALHLQPWNLNYHWAHLKQCLQDQGTELTHLPKWNPEGDTLPEIGEICAPTERAVRTSQAWIAGVSLKMNLDSLKGSEAHTEAFLKRVSTLLRFSPQSAVGWFLKWWLSGTDDAARALSRGQHLSKQLRVYTTDAVSNATVQDTGTRASENSVVEFMNIHSPV